MIGYPYPPFPPHYRMSLLALLMEAQMLCALGDTAMQGLQALRQKAKVKGKEHGMAYEQSGKCNAGKYASRNDA